MRSNRLKTAAILGLACGLAAAAIHRSRSRAAPSAVARVASPAPAEHECQGDDGVKSRADSGVARVAIPAPTAYECQGADRATSGAVQELARGRATAALSAGAVLSGRAEIYAAVGIAADPFVVPGARTPVNLALVFDRSPSMASKGTLMLAREAALQLVESLGPGDQIALISYYQGRAWILLQSVPADPSGKEALAVALHRLTVQPDRLSDLDSGLRLASDEVDYTANGHANQVILLSDGHATAGETRRLALADTARRSAGRGVRITTVGLGADQDESGLKAIADAGRGRYYHVGHVSSLGMVLTHERFMAEPAAMTHVQLRLRPGSSGGTIDHVYDYDSDTDGEERIVHLADLMSGDVRRLVVRLTTADRDLGRVRVLEAELRYRDGATGEDKRACLVLAAQVIDDVDTIVRSMSDDVIVTLNEARNAENRRREAAARAKESP